MHRRRGGYERHSLCWTKWCAICFPIIKSVLFISISVGESVPIFTSSRLSACLKKAWLPASGSRFYKFLLLAPALNSSKKARLLHPKKFHNGSRLRLRLPTLISIIEKTFKNTPLLTLIIVLLTLAKCLKIMNNDIKGIEWMSHTTN